FGERDTGTANEHAHAGGARGIGRPPGRHRARRLRALDRAVDTLREGCAAERAARVLDQGAVERNLLQPLVEKRREMPLQAVAQALRRWARPLQLPIEAHPFLD